MICLTTMTTDDKAKAPNMTKSHDILCSAVTDDYRLSKTKHGYRVVANRRIKKGEVVMDESYEFPFSDVRDGDQSKLLLSVHFLPRMYFVSLSLSFLLILSTKVYLSNLDEANELAAKHEDEELLPTHIPVTRDMLLRSHGVPSITEKSDEEVVVRQLLESPGMFMNHSCDPVRIALFLSLSL